MALQSAIGAEPLSKSLSTAFVRVSAPDFRVALRQEQAAVEGGGRRAAAAGRRGAEILPHRQSTL
jgi:hypothetical protein